MKWHIFQVHGLGLVLFGDEQEENPVKELKAAQRADSHKEEDSEQNWHRNSSQNWSDQG